MSQISSTIFKYKIVLLGDQNVGKTSIINRFMFDNFDGITNPTCGIDFISKTIQYQDRQIRLQLWDTAGQERFRSLISSYIKDTSVAIIVYDITNIQSFNNLKKWIIDVRNIRGDDIQIYLIGNKTDLQDNRKVTFDKLNELSQEMEVQGYEVSAKSGNNVSQFFKQLSDQLPGNENQTQIQYDTSKFSSNQLRQQVFFRKY